MMSQNLAVLGGVTVSSSPAAAVLCSPDDAAVLVSAETDAVFSSLTATVSGAGVAWVAAATVGACVSSVFMAGEVWWEDEEGRQCNFGVGEDLLRSKIHFFLQGLVHGTVCAHEERKDHTVSAVPGGRTGVEYSGRNLDCKDIESMHAIPTPGTD